MIITKKRAKICHIAKFELVYIPDPFVAGVVGLYKFAYDIWGDSVNTASKCTKCGRTWKINISATTYDLVKNQFECTHRGKNKSKIQKDELDMYFVENYKN